MALLKKIVEKLQKVHRLGFSNAWFIFKKRCRDRQNRVNPISLSETDKKKILADSKRKRTSIAVLLRLGETFDVGDKEAAAAVMGQLYGKFHLHEVRSQLEQGGFREAMLWNQVAAQCQEDYLVLCQRGVKLSPAALWMFAEKIDETGANLLYCDEQRGTEKMYKPDFGIDTFLGQDYLGGVLCVKNDVWKEMEGLSETSADPFADMILRIYERGGCIAHIPEILFSSDARGVFPEIGEAVLKEHEEALKLSEKVSEHPLVSVIIPNKDHVKILRQCIDSILQKSTYDRYEILVIENNSTQQETFAYYGELERETRVRVITCMTDWNYSYINNFGAKEAKGEYLLFLNNDTEVIAPDWMEEMLRFAMRPDVGAVGAKLFYPDGTIQHGGVTLGIRGVAGHAFRGEPGNSPGYMNRLVTVQNLSAVTAACMMVPAVIFHKMEGFDERYKVAFNDTDLCMRIRKAGYLIVYNPNAQLHHYESKSRGQDEKSLEKLRRFNEESERFQRQWCRELEMGDPYYNHHLSVWSDNFAPVENG